MQIVLTARTDLDEPDAVSGFITWFDAEILTDEDEAAPVQPVGHAAAALVHIGDMMNVGASLDDVLDEDGDIPSDLLPVYFDADAELREQFRQGFGNDLLYIEQIGIEPGWNGRNVELAVARRLIDIIGGSCELAVMPYAAAGEAEKWQQMGFQLSTPARDRGYLHMQLAFRQARVVSSEGGFKVIPNPRDSTKSH